MHYDPIAEIRDIARGPPSALAWARIGFALCELDRGVSPEDVDAALRPLAAWPEAIRTVEEWIDVDDSPWAWWEAGCVHERAPWLRYVASLSLDPRTLLEAPAASAWRGPALHPRLTWRFAMDLGRGRWRKSTTPEEAAAAVTAFPAIRRLHLIERDAGKWSSAQWLTLLLSEALRGLIELRIDPQAAPRGVITELASAPLATTLEALRLPGCHLRAAVADMMERWPADGALRVLDASGNALSDDGVARLLEAPATARLRALSLGRNAGSERRRDEVYDRLAALGLERLEALDLAGFILPYGGDGTQRIVRALGALPSLRWLSLRETWASDEQGAALARSPAFRRLRYLDLGGTEVADELVAAVIEQPPAALRWLQLDGASQLSLDGLSRLRGWLSRGTPAGRLEIDPPDDPFDDVPDALDRESEAEPPIESTQDETRTVRWAAETTRFELTRSRLRPARGPLGRAVEELNRLAARRPGEQAWTSLGRHLCRRLLGVEDPAIDRQLDPVRRWPSPWRVTNFGSIPADPWWIHGCHPRATIGLDLVCTIYGPPNYVQALPEDARWRTRDLYPLLRWWPGPDDLDPRALPAALSVMPAIRGLQLGEHLELDPHAGGSVQSVWTALWSAPEMARIRALAIRGTMVSRGIDLGALPAGPAGSCLEILEVVSPSGRYEDCWGAPLAAWPERSALKVVRIESATLAEASIASWQGKGWVRQVEALGLSWDGLPLEQVTRWLSSTGAPALIALDVSGNPSRAEAPDLAGLLAAAPRLRALWAVRCGLTDAAVLDLLQSPGFDQLEVLDLGQNPITEATLEAVLRRPRGPALRRLVLPEHLLTARQKRRVAAWLAPLDPKPSFQPPPFGWQGWLEDEIDRRALEGR